MSEAVKTFEEFVACMGSSEEFRRFAYREFLYAENERERHRIKAKKRYTRLREAIPVDQRKPIGRPRKNPLPEEKKETPE